MLLEYCLHFFNSGKEFILFLPKVFIVLLLFKVVKDKIYSNSKLSLYENCPEAYKAKYIDKIFPELPRSINMFLGEIIHQSLEWLYSEVLRGKKVELDELLLYFVESWHKNFYQELRITNGKPEDYINKGIKLLMEYHAKHFPFLENTLATEKEILFELGENYKIRGYADRIVLNSFGEYEIHDYKTNEKMKTQEEVDSDRQLAFYHIGLQELFGKDIRIKLIWHFLAHNKMITSTRTHEQLEQVRKETIALIGKIEKTTIWPACGSRWCDWCEYKRINGVKLKSSLGKYAEVI